MYKKNLRTTLYLFIFLVTIIVSINITVDPGLIYLKKIVTKQKSNEYITKLIHSDYGLSIDGWNERVVKTTFAKKAGSYECVILGSSEIMQISHIRKTGNIQKQCKSLLNLGVSGASLEDIFVFSNILLKNDELPKKVFINIDAWTLKFNMDSSYSTYINEYTEIIQLLGIDDNIRTISYMNEVFKNLINWEYFFSSIDILKEKKSKTFNYLTQQELAPTKPFKYSEGSTTSIILPDGAHIYNKKYLIQQKKNNQNIPMSKGDYKISGKIFDEEAVLYFEKLIEFYKNKNVEVSLVLIPYHPNVFKQGGTKPVQHMEKVNNLVLSMAKKYNLKVYGSYVPEELGCNATEFLDIYHPTTDCLDKIDFSH